MEGAQIHLNPNAFTEMTKVAHGKLVRFGEEMQKEAVMPGMAPYLTGHLRRSIALKVNFSLFFGTVIRIVTECGYGAYQELGFKHWISHKFIRNSYLRPAFEKTLQRFKSGMIK